MIKNRLLFMKKVNMTASAIFSVWHRPLSLPIKHTQMWFKIQLINSNYKMDVDVGADLIRANHKQQQQQKVQNHGPSVKVYTEQSATSITYVNVNIIVMNVKLQTN